MARVPRHFAALLVALALCLGVLPAHAFAATNGPGLYVPSAILMSSDGTVLWSKNPNAHRRVASTIKLLNALVVRDQVSLDKVITVSRDAARIDNGTVGLVAGQKLTVKQLLQIMLVHSANDAADALACGIAGNEKKYVVMMNAKAKQLGLKDTHAADSNGLGKHETCSAHDLAIIAKNVIADPVLRGIVQQRSVRVPRPGGKSETYSTTDQLLGNYRGIEGIKTGYTDPAGYCFVSAAKRDGIELIGVVLGAYVSYDRFSQTAKMLNWGFAVAQKTDLVSADTTMGVVNVEDGVDATVTVHANKSVSMTFVRGTAGFSTRVSLPMSVSAPIQAGQRLGEVLISREGTVVASVPLLADASVGHQPSTPVAAVVGVTRSVARSGWPWSQITAVWAGLGRMLGI